jgi:uncharacterized protein (TIGR03435 family)
MVRNLHLPGCVIFLTVVFSAFAGDAAPQAPATFEVASVKANTSGANQVTVNWQGGVTMVNVPLRAIVQFAYGINTPSRIVGHPDWTNVERFDILAKPPEGLNGVEQMRPMLQALLADRFKMMARLETRELQSYALVTARADGRLGPSLKRSTTVCVGPRGEANPLAIQCAAQGGAAGAVRLVGVPMAQLAPLISLVVGRPVVDRTGLAGHYDLELRFSGDLGSGAPALDAAAPSIFTALQEQLGLKLDAERETVDVLVIDRIERPSEN